MGTGPVIPGIPLVSDVKPESALFGALRWRSAHPTPKLKKARGTLYVKPEMHHVAVVHDVFLAFKAHLAGLARAVLALAVDVIVEGDDFGADKPALEVSVDHARGLRRMRPGAHSPGTY